jgi:Zn-dependent M16 (insulinase) family peptidase
MTFGVGMKGVKHEDTDKVEALIMETLGQLAEEGFEEEMVESALNTIEFRLRENNTGSFPRGIAVMMRSIGWWLYDGKPFEGMRYEAALTAVKQAIANDPNYLQNLIGQYLLQNNHRATLILEPDPELNERLETAEREKLAQIKAAMSEAELQAIIEQTHELKRLQETPDPPEVLAEIPRLTLDDLERENKTIPIDIAEHNGAKILYHDLFTNGILYLDLAFNLQVLSQELLPYVPLFGSALFGVGTEKEDFVKLSQRIGRKTGGVYASNFTTAVRDTPDGAAWFTVRGKATVAHTGELLDILRDVLLTVKLDNQERFKQLVLRAKSGKESSLIPSGHSVVSGRLRAHFNKNDWLSEQMGGVSNLFFLRQLAEDVVNDWPSVLAKLEEIRRLLLNRPGMICNVTLDSENWTAVQPQMHNFLDDLPDYATPMAKWTADFPNSSEGLTMPAQVNYVGKGANLYDLGYELHASMFVISNYVRLTHLWEKVRAQGGAYGAFFSFDQQSGTLNLVSYRDPNLEKTLAAFDNTADFLRDLDLSEDELVKGIISVIGGIDAPQLPDAKGYTSMIRHLTGITDEYRQQLRDEVLATSAADFTSLAEVMDKWVESGHVVVLGSPEAVGKQEGLEIVKVM